MKTRCGLGVALIFALSMSQTWGGEFATVETEAAIELRHGGEVFLTYHKAEVPPPDGVDAIYSRSGFIHPLKTPGGVVVTGIHPADHAHHLGLWHAWVKAEHNGEPVDFWNLGDGTGRVAFRQVVSLSKESDAAGFVVEQDHIALKGGEETPVVVLRETLNVTARLVDGAFEIDYETKQTNVTDHALELPVYRYGGTIAYRGPAHWKNGNSDYLSSEGKTRIDGHETRSRWISMWGSATGEAEAGVVSFTILGHSKNQDAPQRMRVWPPKSNDGAIFFNYVPIQEHPFAIHPGESSTMKYRLVVRDAAPDSAELNERWERFVK